MDNTREQVCTRCLEEGKRVPLAYREIMTLGAPQDPLFPSRAAKITICGDTATFVAVKTLGCPRCLCLAEYMNEPVSMDRESLRCHKRILAKYDRENA